MNRPSVEAKKTEARAGGEKRAGEKVFEVATDLFYRESIRSVGVETIVKQAGVAKISMYRSFQSKDDLIVAYLENRNAGYWRNVDRIIAPKHGNPRAQLRALVDHIAGRVTTPGYRGCPFINYAAEFPDASHPGHRVVAENKQEMRQRLRDLAKAIGARRPAQLADALFLLIEGAYASSQTLGGRDGPAATLSWAVDKLIEAHMPS
ncbi:MAG TPA: TetR/AcrR family transcriptional regulator [Xanthobacteraceae bacterium]|jgi:AcrR family transcriptional regulator|nr:TetR/AcrR family transcriptional regulator [Xanthobacteraceae bacterium]